jgi:hypothetical protein
VGSWQWWRPSIIAVHSCGIVWLAIIQCSSLLMVVFQTVSACGTWHSRTYRALSLGTWQRGHLSCAWNPHCCIFLPTARWPATCFDIQCCCVRKSKLL